MSADAVKVLQATEYARGYEAVEELRGVVALLLAENECLRAVEAAARAWFEYAPDSPEPASVVKGRLAFALATARGGDAA